MKTYTKKQLERWTKRELIHYILILQFNYLKKQLEKWTKRELIHFIVVLQYLLSYREEVEHGKNND